MRVKQVSLSLSLKNSFILAPEAAFTDRVTPFSGGPVQGAGEQKAQRLHHSHSAAHEHAGRVAATHQGQDRAAGENTAAYVRACAWAAYALPHAVYALCNRRLLSQAKGWVAIVASHALCSMVSSQSTTISLGSFSIARLHVRRLECVRPVCEMGAPDAHVFAANAAAVAGRLPRRNSSQHVTDSTLALSPFALSHPCTLAAIHAAQCAHVADGGPFDNVHAAKHAFWASNIHPTTVASSGREPTYHACAILSLSVACLVSWPQ